MSNKVIFGFEKVHVAFQGVVQVESIEVLTGCTLDGEMTVTVTGAPLSGGNEACKVPVSTESHGTAAQVASTVVDVFNNNADISANYTASHIGPVIYLTAKIVAANDPTLLIAFTPGSTGVTVGASTNVTAGATGWGVPIAIPGAVSFSPSSQGEETKFYADNNIYFTVNKNNGYTAELEMALVPNSVLAQMLGWTVDSNNMLVEMANGIPIHFALMGQIEGDDKNRRFVYYDCVANRPDKEHKTKSKSIEPQTDVLNLNITPITVNGNLIVKGVMELSATNGAAYNAFFNAVTVPAL